ncbi:MAG: DNA-protecting protein DprA [Epulopiscium sp.]|nr:DNA-protecting protein DprA [Candidatus Epulonipiscium sp.]
MECITKDSFYWAWITTIRGIKKDKMIQLINYFKSPEELWHKSKKELKDLSNLSEEELNILDKSKNPNQIKKWLYNLQQKNISYLTINDKKYPSLLKTIPDAPLGIYTKGELPTFEKGFLAVVGPRKCSEYGIRVTRKLVYDLVSKGFGIISGLAQGIDTEAHKATIEADGILVSIVANGVDICYPAFNKKLMESIEKRGTIISEYPPGTKPMPWFFPARNRIISGLSQGIIVIEAEEKSGALITADLALEQGKEVYAVPGSIFNSTSKGTNKLIQQGAKLVMNVEDILEEISIKPMDKRENTSQYKDKTIGTLAMEENLVYDCISFEPSHIDVLSVSIKYPINRLQSILTLLELKGLIKQLPGKRFIRNQ